MSSQSNGSISLPFWQTYGLSHSAFFVFIKGSRFLFIEYVLTKIKVNSKKAGELYATAVAMFKRVTII